MLGNQAGDHSACPERPLNRDDQITLIAIVEHINPVAIAAGIDSNDDMPGGPASCVARWPIAVRAASRRSVAKTKRGAGAGGY